MVGMGLGGARVVTVMMVRRGSLQWARLRVARRGWGAASLQELLRVGGGESCTLCGGQRASRVEGAEPPLCSHVTHDRVCGGCGAVMGAVMGADGRFGVGAAPGPPRAAPRVRMECP
jgi:hypothetical protein